MVVIVAVVLAAVLAGLVIHRSWSLGTPVAAERVDVSAGASVSVTAVGERRGGDQSVVAATVADLQRFWDVAGLRSGYSAVDTATAASGALCAPTPAAVAGNAFYCPTDDGIVYDAAGLVPVLLDRYGVAGLSASLAHEFGHAVQARVGPTVDDRAGDAERYPSILVEAQADCAAGAFLRNVTNGSAAGLRFGEGSLVRAFGPLLDFRDPVDTDPAGAVAHGLAVDRLRFVLKGYRGEPEGCRELAVDDLGLALGRVPQPPSAAPRYPDDAAVLAAAATSVADFSPAGHATPASHGDLAAAQPYGQFAAAAAVAIATGRARSDSPGAAACFAGAWTASVFGHASPDELGGWPGDADEALDLIRERPGATFADLSGFADGFDGGLPACPA